MKRIIQKMINNICRVIDKTLRELYRLFHPIIWGKRVQINGIPRIYGENLILGKDISLNPGVIIQTSGGVEIGDRCTISRGVTILTASLDTSDYLENSKQIFRDHTEKKVVIEEGVWLAANAIVCPGVTIAKESIVAAGSVVCKDLAEPGCLYAGNPAKMIKKITTKKE